MATWLFIGTIFATMLVFAFLLGRRRVASDRADARIAHSEHRRRSDAAAADAARQADARLPPFQGGHPI